MPLADFAPPIKRVGRDLPPCAPLPAALQTLACRLWPIAYLERCSLRYGSRFTVYPVDMDPLVFLSDPEDVRSLYAAPSTHLRSGSGGDVVAPLFGESAFMLHDGDEHLRGRSHVAPAFRRAAISRCEPMISRLLEDEAKSWPVGTAFPIHDSLRALTLRIALEAFVGRCEGFEELHRQLIRLLSVMASLVLQEPRLRHLPGWRRTWNSLLRRRLDVDRLIFELIARRRACGAREDLLGRLLAAQNQDGSPFSDRQIRDNLVSVLVAGHETTAAELAWGFQLLAHNPPVQDRLAQEIHDGRGEDYLTATVHEILRHRPVFLFSAPREVVQPIEIGGWTYRPPVRLLACNYLLQHDPAFHPEPEEFRPERFLGGAPPARAWLPWGGGRKRCLGQGLAMLELRAVLRFVLARWSIAPAGPRIERPRWRTVLVSPHAGSRIVLCAPRPSPTRLPGRSLAGATV